MIDESNRGENRNEGESGPRDSSPMKIAAAVIGGAIVLILLLIVASVLNHA